MTYRADIDGLRAIAVLAVIFYHLKLPLGLGGGYIGVDIFFVISGYLIGGIIIEETAKGSFSYVQFYSRRIKRLFAAFLVVGLVAALVGGWLLLPFDYRPEGKSLFAATVFLSNVLFRRESGYFDPEAVTKPLLHTWSLGVEEQFYLFFPLLMRLALRSGRAGVPLMLAAISIASLVYSQYMLAIDPTASFYLLPSRAWELLLGAAVAQPLVRDIRIPARVGRLVTYLAVLPLLGPIFLYGDATPFPGLTALPSCAAAAWLLWWGRHACDTRVQQALRAKVLVAIGKISYSLYLWHWPIYVFILYYEAGELGWIGRTVAFALTFVLATLSWYFIENPVRYTRRPPKVIFTGAAIGSLLLAGVGCAIWRSDGAPARLSDQTRVIAEAAADFSRTNDRCRQPENSEMPGIRFCRVGVAEPLGQFLVWGDSHARAILDGVDQVAKEHGLGGLLIFEGGCMPAFGILKQESATGPSSDNECTAQNIAVQALLEHPNSVRKILLVGRWAYYAEGEGTGMDRQNLIRLTRAPASAESAASEDSTQAHADQATVVAQALKDTVHWLRARGYEVFLLEDDPEIPEYTGRKLFQVVRSGRSSVEDAVARFGTVDRAEVERRQARANLALRLAAEGGNATIIATHDLFCSGKVCSVWSPSGPAYFDNNHITGATSKKIRQVFLPALTPDR